jgi:hypothetical protein
MFLIFAAATTALAVACGSGSSSSSQNGSFPFSGPSCPPGTQATGGQATGACASCLESQCSESCVVADCSAYFTCACACNPGDATCAQGCIGKNSQACQSCLGGIAACLLQTCGNACFGGFLDGGSMMHCSQLAPCCSSPRFTTPQQMACAQVLVSGNDAACQQALATYSPDGGGC